MQEIYVLDSFAILGWLHDEPSAEFIENLFFQAQEEHVKLYMSALNLGEVAYIVERRQGEDKVRTLLAYLESTPLEVIVPSKEQILAAAHIKAKYPISYAVAFAAALTQELNGRLLTGDPEFRALQAKIKIEWLEQRSK